MTHPKALAIALFLLSGSAVAAPDTAATTLAPSASQQATARTAFAWLSRDAAVLEGAVSITTSFNEVPGVQERQGRLVAKVRDRKDMATQIVREARLEQASAMPARGVAVLDQTDFADLWAQADNRMAEARARLAPSLIEAHDDVDVHAFHLPEGWTEEQAAALLMATGDYEYVEPDWAVYPLATTPNDPLFGNQWHHRAQNMNSVGAWDFVTGGSDIIVAVCDTGVRLNHTDLAASLVPGFNATTNLAQVSGGVVDDLSNGHGTLVAGCMAARGNNGTGIAGIGWGFSIMPVRVSDRSDGVASLSDILQGARWASDNGAFAVNCSYGGSNSSQTNTTGNQIRAEGHLLVFASGNDGVQDQNSDWVNVTIVGASNTANAVASFSNYGIGVDVIAPGSNIYSTTRTGGYGNATGTSFSSPLTAASMALVKAANSDLTADQVEQIIFDTALDVGAAGEDINSGHGMVRVGEAVEAALDGPARVDLPFLQDFATGTLPNLWRDAVGTIEVNQNAAGLPAGDYAMNLDATDQIASVKLRALFIGFDTGEISFDVQHQGVEAGESLLVEYVDIVSGWQPLTTVTSDGVNSTGFERVRVAMPLFAKHDDLAIRFTAQGSDGTDDWHIDNVAARLFEGNSVPWGTGFENGIDTSFDWLSSSASLTTEAAAEGSNAARLANAGTMTSRPIDFTTASGAVYLRLRTRDAGVEAGESLTIEYSDIVGAWQTLTTIASDGADSGDFDLHQISLPFAAFGPAMAVRITSNANAADDVWYIDDVAVTPEFVVDEPDCPADLDGNGSLNFFDISAFLGLFNAQDPAADLDNTGTWNFFDISAYLGQFNAGCP
jgi:hypothetical protein